jgi:hypothetical protein
MSATAERAAAATVSRTPENQNPSAPELVSASKGQAVPHHLCIWQGLGLPNFLKLLTWKPEISRSCLDRLISSAVMSVVNSTLNTAERLTHGRRIRRQEIRQAPVFILGHWRSGTTMLHNLMTLNPRMTYLNLYQCLFPGHFLLTESVLAPATASLLPPTRPMDDVPVSWSSPQEDEVALAVDCLYSPYVMAAFQGRLDMYERFLDPADMSDKERARWTQSLMTLIRKMALKKDARVLMKSPSHTYRVPTLLKMFPDARFIYIRRNPCSVYQSTMHLRKTMFAENTLGSMRPDVWSEETLYLYERCIRKYEAAKHLIPQGHLFELRFEDLERTPFDTIKNLHQSLGLEGWQEMEPALRTECERIANYRKNIYRMPPETRQLVESRLRWVFDLYGYPLTTEEQQAA